MVVLSLVGLLFSREFVPGDSANWPPKGIAPLPGAGWVLVGSKASSGTALVVDGSGAVVWAKSYYQEKAGEMDFLGASAARDSTLWVVGSYEDSLPLVVHLGSDGGVLGAWSYTPSLPGTYSLLVAGAGRDTLMLLGNSDDRFFSLGIDSGGNPLWFRQYYNSDDPTAPLELVDAAFVPGVGVHALVKTTSYGDTVVALALLGRRGNVVRAAVVYGEQGHQVVPMGILAYDTLVWVFGYVDAGDVAKALSVKLNANYEVLSSDTLGDPSLGAYLADGALVGDTVVGFGWLGWGPMVVGLEPSSADTLWIRYGDWGSIFALLGGLPAPPGDSGWVAFGYEWEDALVHYPLLLKGTSGYLECISEFPLSFASYQMASTSLNLGSLTGSAPASALDPVALDLEVQPDDICASQAVGEGKGSELRAWFSGGKLWVLAPRAVRGALKVYDPSGRLVATRQLELSPGLAGLLVPGKGVRIVLLEVGGERVSAVAY